MSYIYINKEISKHQFPIKNTALSYYFPIPKT